MMLNKNSNFSLGRIRDVDNIFTRRLIKIGKGPVFCSHGLLRGLNLMEEVVTIDWPQFLSYIASSLSRSET